MNPCDQSLSDTASVIFSRGRVVSRAKFMKKRIFVYLILSVFFICGCGSLAVLKKRQNIADDLASKNGFHKDVINTEYFTLTTYQKIADVSKPVNVYIEGDGYAWVSRTILSYNPTPRYPFMLALAGVDPAENVVYIARPCQYTDPEQEKLFDYSYWSDKRFSEEIIVSVNTAINKIMGQYGLSGIHLIGHSGGGAVAVLVASRNNDVFSIRTIAANLDHVELNKYHKVSPMKGSLNAIDVAEQVSSIPQRHFLGSKDKRIPEFIVKRFLQRSGDDEFDSLLIVDGCDHDDGWKDKWVELLKEPLV